MADRSKNGQFKAGHTGGPGRPRLPADLKAAKKMTKAQALMQLSAALACDVPTLKRLLEHGMKKGEVPAFEMWAASIVLKGIRDGDERRLNFMLDRLIGKVTEKVEHSVPKPTIIERFDGSGYLELDSGEVKDGE